MRKHVHRWESPLKGFPQKFCRCGAMRVPEMKVGKHTLSMSGDLLTWSGSVNPGAMGAVGMDTATGRLICYVGGAAKAVMVTGD